MASDERQHHPASSAKTYNMPCDVFYSQAASLVAFDRQRNRLALLFFGVIPGKWLAGLLLGLLLFLETRI